MERRRRLKEIKYESERNIIEIEQERVNGEFKEEPEEVKLINSINLDNIPIQNDFNEDFQLDSSDCVNSEGSESSDEEFVRNHWKEPAQISEVEKEKIKKKRKVYKKNLNQLKCEICDRVFKRNHNFKVHRCTFCKFCNKKFKDPSHFMHHMRTQHSEREKFECDFCGRNFKGKRNLVIHILESHSMVELKYQCDHCPKRFATKSTIQHHLRMHQKVEYPCKFCGKKFKKKHLSPHVRVVHGVSKDFKCQQCPKIFKSRNLLSLHEKSHDKKFECKICGRKFALMYRFKDHMGTHANPEGVKCEICGKFSKSGVQLSSHMRRVHPGENKGKFKCEKCDYKTHMKIRFKRHQKYHEKFEKKLKSRSDWIRCEKCPLSVFTTKKYYRRHVKNVHSEIKHECDLCGRKYKRKTHILQHFKRHHLN